MKAEPGTLRQCGQMFMVPIRMTQEIGRGLSQELSDWWERPLYWGIMAELYALAAMTGFLAALAWPADRETMKRHVERLESDWAIHEARVRGIVREELGNNQGKGVEG